MTCLEAGCCLKLRTIAAHRVSPAQPLAEQHVRSLLHPAQLDVAALRCCCTGESRDGDPPAPGLPFRLRGHGPVAARRSAERVRVCGARRRPPRAWPCRPAQSARSAPGTRGEPPPTEPRVGFATPFGALHSSREGGEPAETRPRPAEPCRSRSAAGWNRCRALASRRRSLRSGGRRRRRRRTSAAATRLGSRRWPCWGTPTTSTTSGWPAGCTPLARATGTRRVGWAGTRTGQAMKEKIRSAASARPHP